MPSSVPDAIELAQYATYRAQNEPSATSWYAAVKTWSNALAVAEDVRSPESAAIATGLANAFEDLYGVTGDLADLDESIRLTAALVDSASDLSYRASLAADLGARCAARFSISRDREDIDLAIEAYDMSIASGQLDPMRAESILGNGALARYQRGRAFGHLPSLNEAIQQFRSLRDAADPANRANARSNLGIALRTRFNITHHEQDVEDSVTAQTEALALIDPSSVNWPRWLTNLGNVLNSRFELTGHKADLDDAIAAQRTAVARHREHGDRELTTALVNLGHSLATRFERYGNEEDRGQAFDAIDEVLAIGPRGSAEWLLAVVGMAGLLRRRYQDYGAVEDLDQARVLAGYGIEYAAGGTAQMADALVLSGQLHRLRFAVYGESSDIEAAMRDLAAAVSMTVPGSATWLAAQASIGESLLTRHKVLGDHSDLQAAIETLESALRNAPEGSTVWADIAASTAECLDLRFSVDQELRTIDDAIGLYQAAIRRVEVGSVKFARWTTGLGIALSLRAELSGADTDLDMAIDVMRTALATTDPRTSSFSEVQIELATALTSRYQITERTVDLDDAIALADTAAATEVQLHGAGERAWCAHTVGEAHRFRYSALGAPADKELAARAYSRVLAMIPSGVPSSIRVGSAAGLAELHAEDSDWTPAADAYRLWLDAFDEYYDVQLLGSGRDATLQASGALFQRAAYSLARAGSMSAAVMALERGSARALAAALEVDRAVLADLDARYPAEATKFRRAANQLRVIARDERSITVGPRAERVDTPQAERAGTRDQTGLARSALSAAINSIRALPSFEGFLQRPSLPDILGRVAHHSASPLLYLTATRWGGLGLLVFPASQRIEPIWLDGLGASALNELLLGRAGAEPEPRLRWFDAYQSWHAGANDQDRAATSKHFADAIEQLSAALWDRAIGPVLAAVREHSANELTIVPSGLLGQLPLHAASFADATASTGRRYALDLLSMSYAASAGVRAHCLEYLSAQRDDARLGDTLVVKEPSPVSAAALPGAEVEAFAAAGAVNGQAVVVAGPDATQQRVLQEIAAASVTHFCCHGRYDAISPLNSGLLMSNDELLSVRDLLGAPIGRSSLAVLSACESGMAGIELPNEFVGLPSALIQAGFAAVIASHWAINDLATSLLMHRFYFECTHGADTARALGRAQAWLRDTTNNEKAHWYEQLTVASDPRTRQAAHLALEIIRPSLARHGQQRSFEHPYWWAGFSLTGAAQTD